MLQLVTTGDGSKTLFHPEIGEHYHSRHGAHQESQHVFVDSGFNYFLEHFGKETVRILEVGFGTGLNFLLTAKRAAETKTQVQYTGIEAFPLSPEILAETGYQQYVSSELWSAFLNKYPACLNQRNAIQHTIDLQIITTKLEAFDSSEQYDLVYFDAFAAIHQPEMWTDAALAIVAKHMKPTSVFVTYAITGNLKRSMKSLGFSIEKAPGAPGKREMLRATKIEA